MSKTIKLENAVYDRLTGLMWPKESYSKVIERMLDTFDKLGPLKDVLEGAVAYRQGQQERRGEVPSLPDVIGTDSSGKPLIERTRH